jgi:hypothetical protein
VEKDMPCPGSLKWILFGNRQATLAGQLEGGYHLEIEIYCPWHGSLKGISFGNRYIGLGLAA